MSAQTSGLVRRTLMDFVPVAVFNGAVLLPRQMNTPVMRRNIHAAIAATFLRVSSLDGVLDRYTLPEDEYLLEPSDEEATFTRALGLVESTQAEVGSRFRECVGVDPTIGEFAAEVALSRLSASFDAAAVLYNAGFAIEGDAISRLVLEQIAWSIRASRLEAIDDVQRLKPANCIGELEQAFPGAGRIYGHLSGSAHASLDHHRASVTPEGDAVNLAHRDPLYAADVLLYMVDKWASAYEWTQQRFYDEVLFVERGSDLRQPERRPLVDVRSEIAQSRDRQAY